MLVGILAGCQKTPQPECKMQIQNSNAVGGAPFTV
jgi:hypothetical protein